MEYLKKEMQYELRNKNTSDTIVEMEILGL